MSSTLRARRGARPSRGHSRRRSRITGAIETGRSRSGSERTRARARAPSLSLVRSTATPSRLERVQARALRDGVGRRPRDPPRVPGAARARRALLLPRVRRAVPRGEHAGSASASTPSNPTGATRLYERVGMRVASQADVYEEAVREGRPRGRCRACARSAPTARRSPRSRSGPELRVPLVWRATFGAGLVRVPRAWGKGGEAMAEAARARARRTRKRRSIAEDTLEDQTSCSRPSFPSGRSSSAAAAARTSAPSRGWRRGTTASPSSGSTPTAT